MEKNDLSKVLVQRVDISQRNYFSICSMVDCRNVWVEGQDQHGLSGGY
jgi:hypothetical protein